MKRQVFLIPGFFGFANLGDFAYWGPVRHKLRALLDDAGMEAQIHCVKSLPTASLRARTRCLLEAIKHARPGRNTAIHLIGHSTGGLDARLLLTPAVDLCTRIDVESVARKVQSSISIATPHQGAPIATFFANLLGHDLLRLLSIVTIAALRGIHLPLSVWVEIAGLFALPSSFRDATGSLASQLYEQLLSDFNAERHKEVEELLGEVQRDQSLLTQLTVESMDLFNAVAGDRDSVSYGAVVTRARPAGFDTSCEIGFDLIDQAQQAFYYSLSKLAVGHELPPPNTQFAKQMRKELGEVPDSNASDGIVPTLSQPWGDCIAVAQADHLDIIGHHGGADGDPERRFDWLATRSHFRAPQFDSVWGNVVSFIAKSEAGTR